MPSPTADPTQPAIETIREVIEALRQPDIRINGCACTAQKLCYLHGVLVPDTLAALSAVETDLRRKEEALTNAETHRFTRVNDDGSSREMIEIRMPLDVYAALADGGQGDSAP